MSNLLKKDNSAYGIIIKNHSPVGGGASAEAKRVKTATRRQVIRQRAQARKRKRGY